MKPHIAGALALAIAFVGHAGAQDAPLLTGAKAFGSIAAQKPGVRHLIRAEDLPAIKTGRATGGRAPEVKRPADAVPQGPEGFHAALYADGFQNARLMRTAPNGDIFLSDMYGSKVWVLRGVDANGRALKKSVFLDKLDRPFGIQFYPQGPNPQWIYIATVTTVLRFPYHSGDLTAAGKAETIVKDLPGIVTGYTHFTKDLAFSPDGRRLFVTVGSATDDVETKDFKTEKNRADILEYTPEGQFLGIYASGIRNCVGETINPATGELWCSTNERDMYGDDLVPDWISSVPRGSNFGWPFYYIGNHADPLFADMHPRTGSPVKVPDVILTTHMASLEMVFYPLKPFPNSTVAFPAEYRGDAFAAEHGSSIRNPPVGYEVIRVPMKNGRAGGEYDDFLTGFTLPDGGAWGRPVGVAVGSDGALFVSEDRANTVWRITYTRPKQATPPRKP